MRLVPVISLIDLYDLYDLWKDGESNKQINEDFFFNCLVHEKEKT